MLRIIVGRIRVRGDMSPNMPYVIKKSLFRRLWKEYEEDLPDSFKISGFGWMGEKLSHFRALDGLEKRFLSSS